jgi:hypothetical protein
VLLVDAVARDLYRNDGERCSLRDDFILSLSIGLHTPITTTLTATIPDKTATYNYPTASYQHIIGRTSYFPMEGGGGGSSVQNPVPVP